nr:hypothetical protein Itr_chr05CG02860 [Ipomoea trifida]
MGRFSKRRGKKTDTRYIQQGRGKNMETRRSNHRINKYEQKIVHRREPEKFWGGKATAHATVFVVVIFSRKLGPEA